MVFLLKFFLSFDRIQAYTENLHPFLLQLRVRVAEAAGLRCTARAHRLRVEIDQGVSSFCDLAEVDRFSVLIRRRDRRNRIAEFQLAIRFFARSREQRSDEAACPDQKHQKSLHLPKYKSVFGFRISVPVSCRFSVASSQGRAEY